MAFRYRIAVWMYASRCSSQCRIHWRCIALVRTKIVYSTAKRRSVFSHGSFLPNHLTFLLMQVMHAVVVKHKKKKKGCTSYRWLHWIPIPTYTKPAAADTRSRGHEPVFSCKNTSRKLATVACVYR